MSEEDATPTHRRLGLDGFTAQETAGTTLLFDSLCHAVMHDINPSGDVVTAGDHAIGYYAAACSLVQTTVETLREAVGSGEWRDDPSLHVEAQRMIGYAEAALKALFGHPPEIET